METTKANLQEKLVGLLKQMSVPKQRFDDYKWLSQNLGLKNKNHPKFAEARGLVVKLLKMNDGNE